MYFLDDDYKVDSTSKLFLSTSFHYNSWLDASNSSNSFERCVYITYLVNIKDPTHLIHFLILNPWCDMYYDASGQTNSFLATSTEYIPSFTDLIICPFFFSFRPLCSHDLIHYSMRPSGIIGCMLHVYMFAWPNAITWLMSWASSILLLAENYELMRIRRR